jgi:hypothetical protein
MEGLGLGLDEEAVSAVKQWEYKMNTGAAAALQAIIDADVQFRLDPPGPWDVVSESYSVVKSNQRHKEVDKPVPVR